MPRLRVPFALCVAISLLTILALRQPRAASARGTLPSDTAGCVPVLIELFTSEGCSDCPPADSLLQKLDRLQPVAGAELIVLSEHVDYWDDIGWRDPFSSHQYSVRQEDYAHQFGIASPYTPQMVVDGKIEFVGSDERRAIQAIANETKTAKVALNLSDAHFDSNKRIALHIESGPMPADSPSNSANVMLAVADESDESHVIHGENGGRTLKHVAVLRNLAQVGSVDKTTGFSQDVSIDAKNVGPQNLRIVAIVQEKTAGKVWGVGYVPFSK